MSILCLWQCIYGVQKVSLKETIWFHTKSAFWQNTQTSRILFRRFSQTFLILILLSQGGVQRMDVQKVNPKVASTLSTQSNKIVDFYLVFNLFILLYGTSDCCHHYCVWSQDIFPKRYSVIPGLCLYQSFEMNWDVVSPQQQAHISLKFNKKRWDRFSTNKNSKLELLCLRKLLKRLDEDTKFQGALKGAMIRHEEVQAQDAWTTE